MPRHLFTDGADELGNVKDEKTAIRYLKCIHRTLEHGRDVMMQDEVQYYIPVMETLN